MIKAKDSSLAGQIVAAVWIAVWSGVKFLRNPELSVIDDIIRSGVAIAICFTPVYFSILVDKFRGKNE